jgi:hypothetical protein
MKTTIAILLVAVLATSCLSNRYSPPADKIVQQQVIDVPGQKQGQIYGRVVEWASSYFVNAQAAMEASDRETGLIIYRSGYDANKYYFNDSPISTQIHLVTYKVKIEVKDEKIRVTVGPPSVRSRDYSYFPTEGAFDEYDSYAKSAIANLKDHLSRSSSMTW